MTTKAAERLYLAEHLNKMEGKRSMIYNPKNLPIKELPVIMGFNNGGSMGWWRAVALAEDGECLGEHLCSDEGYMSNDLGILKGTRLDRHEKDYQPHYPNGYRMEFVPSSQIEDHAKLQAAFKANQEKRPPGDEDDD